MWIFWIHFIARRRRLICIFFFSNTKKLNFGGCGCGGCAGVDRMNFTSINRRAPNGSIRVGNMWRQSILLDSPCFFTHTHTHESYEFFVFFIFKNEFSLSRLICVYWLSAATAAVAAVSTIHCSLFYLSFFFFFFSFITFTLKRYLSLVWIIRSAYCRYVCVREYARRVLACASLLWCLLTKHSLHWICMCRTEIAWKSLTALS